MRASIPITSSQTAALVNRVRNEYFPRFAADVARREIARIQGAYARPYLQYVDGVKGAPLESIRVGGKIVFKFPDLGEILDWIYQELVLRSPIGPERGQPHYYQVHWLFADGVKVDVPEGADSTEITGAVECMFVNARPYARRLENGWSLQAPDGVYELVALEAQRKWQWASIVFKYVAMGDIPAEIPWVAKAYYRYPTITVKASP